MAPTYSTVVPEGSGYGKDLFVHTLEDSRMQNAVQRGQRSVAKPVWPKNRYI